MRADKYFAYSHLPAPLQDVSKPICELASAVASQVHTPRTFAMEAMEVMGALEAEYGDIAPDQEEWVCGIQKITRTIAEGDGHYRMAGPDDWMGWVLRQLLEAKDCLVRAILPDD